MKNDFFVTDSPECPEELAGTDIAPCTLNEFYEAVSNKKALSLDSETLGLRPFHGDTMFAITISDGVFAWYFECGGGTLPAGLVEMFLDPSRLWHGQNIKFDCHHLEQSFGVRIAGTLHCTAIGARIEHNDHLSYSLDACLKRIGLEKHDTVKAYIKEHKLKTVEPIPHKKIGRDNLHFEKVPRPIMVPYACQDARGTFLLAEDQIKKIKAMDVLLPTAPPAWQVVELERKLMPCVIAMERGGVRIDLPYCERAIEALSATMEKDKNLFQEVTGAPLKDSWQALSKVFAEEKLRWGRTEKGNPSFSSDILETFESPAAAALLRIRNAKSRVDFFATFLSEADRFGYVHPSFNSGGTATRRFSSSGPNFQNLTNDDEATSELWSPRKAIIPPEDCLILSADYKQQEYVILLDYSGQMDVIEQVKNGADIHQATADMVGVTRRYAKTLNFMLLYGGGVAKLCMALFKPTVDFETLQAICFLHLYQMDRHDDVKKHRELVANLPSSVIEENMAELVKARDLREIYFSKLPMVKKFINTVVETGEMRGYIYNWFGMRYRCNRRYSYTLPNRIIQGGGAEIGKLAMVGTSNLLATTRSRLFLPVHDELDFYLHRSELHLAGEIKRIMEGVYPAKHLPMRVDLCHSWKSLGELEDGAPVESREAS